MMRTVVVAMLLTAVSAEGHAQLFTPSYQSPRLVNEFGIGLSDGPGSLAIEGIWRAGPLGLRLGYADVDDGALMLGGELRNPLQIVGAPLGLAFTAGVQGLIGDRNAYGGQAGLSAGYTFLAPGIGFTPYLHPRLGVVQELHENDLRLRALADVGVDVEFYNNLLVRFGAALDGVGASWGFGLAIRR
jgi:hypothetical protein